MKIDNVNRPQSSFLSVEKDMSILTDKIIKNERLKRLLYYTTSDALTKPKLSEDESLELFGKNIKIIPKLVIDNSVSNYLIISFNGFTQSQNPQFRDNVIEFDILCNYDQWMLKDFQLRPYKIAAEIDSMFNHQKLTGIGQLEFLGANRLLMTEDCGGLCLMYKAIHGGEDKIGMPNPADEEQFLKDFEDYINS